MAAITGQTLVALAFLFVLLSGCASTSFPDQTANAQDTDKRLPGLGLTLTLKASQEMATVTGSIQNAGPHDYQIPTGYCGAMLADQLYDTLRRPVHRHESMGARLGCLALQPLNASTSQPVSMTWDGRLWKSTGSGQEGHYERADRGTYTWKFWVNVYDDSSSPTEVGQLELDLKVRLD